MTKTFLFLMFSSVFLPEGFTFSYQESTSEMLVQCNSYQSEIFSENRTVHQCERDNFNEAFSYVIEPMQTRYSKQKFLCFLFLKDEFHKLKFRLWLSHKNFDVDAYGVKYNKPLGDKWESRILFKTTVFVVVPHKGQPVPQIFGFELNEVDKCPLCGKKLENAKLVNRISGGDDSDSVRWPWHSTVYEIKQGSFSYICGGTLIQSKAVITSANCVTNKGKKISENTLQAGFGESQLLADGSLRANIFRSIVHQSFDYETFENDIALLMLDTQIKFSSNVLPICLPNVGVNLQGYAIAVGFGSTATNNEGSSTLQEVEIPIVDNNECLESDSEFYEKFLNHGNFCAGKKGVVKNVCGGDAGGGLYVSKNNLWNLKGITSITDRRQGAKNPTCNDYAIFTDISRFLDWIEEETSSI